MMNPPGFSPDKLQQPSQFIGCIRGVKFLEGTRVIPSEETDEGALQEGCLDRCETQNPCQNDGGCVNHYTEAVCDCYGTGHEGAYCDEPGNWTIIIDHSIA